MPEKDYPLHLNTGKDINRRPEQVGNSDLMRQSKGNTSSLI
jgi:hypothetical protein